jgi:hypothetical protein
MTESHVDLGQRTSVRCQPLAFVKTAPAGLQERLENPEGHETGSGKLVIGVVSGLVDDGPLLDLVGHPGCQSLRAQSVVPINEDSIGRKVAILFENGNPQRPVIIGVLQSPAEVKRQTEIRIDGEKLVIAAKKELVLNCGSASITLTRAGKVLICGEYVLTKAKGVNRVRGASVQIN